MKWERLLCAKRESGEKTSGFADLEPGSAFEKDYHRIIGSSTFRRLQDKTQVFALDKSDFIRTRLTHSLEVSSFAKSLGERIAQELLEKKKDPAFLPGMKSDVCDILLCAGLIHDIGNPPFGHFGEEAIRDWFGRRMKRLFFGNRPVTEVLTGQMQKDFLNFEGNAQAFRQVTRLHFLVDAYGMDLTYGLLNTMVKYPVSSLDADPEGGKLSRSKVGYYLSEQPLYRKISSATGAAGVRHPLTFILEAADDMAYRTADIEDAYKKGCFTYDTLCRELMEAGEKAREEGFLVDLARLDPVAVLQHFFQYAQSSGLQSPGTYAVQNFASWVQRSLTRCAAEGFLGNYDAIMEGRYEHDLFYGSCGDWISRSLGDIAYRFAFTSAPILRMEVSAYTILNFLMDRFVPAVMHYDSPYPMGMMEKKMVELISGNYRQVYHFHSKGLPDNMRLYLRMLLVTDFISGMTDSYAKDLYQKLNGIS